MAEWRYGQVLRRPAIGVAEDPDACVMFLHWAEDGPPEDRPFNALVLSPKANSYDFGDVTPCWTPFWEPVDD